MVIVFCQAHQPSLSELKHCQPGTDSQSFMKFGSNLQTPKLHGLNARNSCPQAHSSGSTKLTALPGRGLSSEFLRYIPNWQPSKINTESVCMSCTVCEGCWSIHTNWRQLWRCEWKIDLERENLVFGNWGSASTKVTVCACVCLSAHCVFM